MALSFRIIFEKSFMACRCFSNVSNWAFYVSHYCGTITFNQIRFWYTLFSNQFNWKMIQNNFQRIKQSSIHRLFRCGVQFEKNYWTFQSFQVPKKVLCSNPYKIGHGPSRKISVKFQLRSVIAWRGRLSLVPVWWTISRWKKFWAVFWSEVLGALRIYQKYI